MIMIPGKHAFRTELALNVFEKLMPRRLALLLPLAWSAKLAAKASSISFLWADTFIANSYTGPTGATGPT